MVSRCTTTRNYFACGMIVAATACVLGGSAPARGHDIPVNALLYGPGAAGVGVDMGNHQEAVRIVLTISPPSFVEDATIKSTEVKDQSGEMIWTRQEDASTTSHIWWGEGGSTNVDGSVWIQGTYTVPGGEGGSEPTFDVLLAVVNARVDNAADHHDDPDGHWPPAWPDELADATEATEWGGLRIPAGMIENPFGFPPKLSELGENVTYKTMEIEVYVRVPQKWKSDTVGYLSYALTNTMGSPVPSHEAGLAVYVENEEGTDYELMHSRDIPGTGLTGEGNRIRCAVVTNSDFTEPVPFRVRYEWSHDDISWHVAYDDILFRPWENGRFAPAVVLKKADGETNLVSDGRGLVPHIPLNAILPENCSGTGQAGKVKFALELDHPAPEEMTFAVSIAEPAQPKAQLLDGSTLTIAQGKHFSDENDSDDYSVIQGNALSTSMADSSTIVAMRSGSPGEVVARMHLVNYEFHFERVHFGSPMTYICPVIDHPTTDTSAWPSATRRPWGNMYPTTPEVVGDGADLYGLSDRKGKERWSDYDVSWNDQPIQLERLGGASFVALDHGASRWVLYNRTSHSRLLHNEYMIALCNQAGHPIGDQRTSFPHYRLWHVPMQQLRDIAIRFEDANHGIEVHPSEPHSGRVRIKRGDVGENVKFSWWLKPHFQSRWDVANDHITQSYSQASPAFMLTTRPLGAFEGKLQGGVHAKREAEYSGRYFTPPRADMGWHIPEALDLGLAALTMKWDKVLTSFVSLMLDLDTQKATACQAGLSVNFALEFCGRSQDSYRVRLVDTTDGIIKTLSPNAAHWPWRPGEEPSTVNRAFHANPLIAEDAQFEGAVPEVYISTADWFVFPVVKKATTPQGPAKPHVWVHTVASAGARKNHERAFIEAKLILSAVEIDLRGESTDRAILHFDVAYADEE